MSILSPRYFMVFCLSSSLSLSIHAEDQLGNMLKQAIETATEATTPKETKESQPTATPKADAADSETKAALGAGMETAEVNQGLKQMLLQGSQQAISALGTEGGFLNNAEVKIALPDSMSLLAKGLRNLGQGQYVDDFVKSMNTAAEKAVPEAAEVFSHAIESMTPQDALKVLNGGDSSVTDYFKQSSTEELKQRFMPLIKASMDSSGVTTAYKTLMEQTQSNINVGGIGVGELLGGGKNGFDLDQYVTDKSLDGLFSVMAQEEAKIRSNPAARATDLLKQIFGG